MLYVDGNGADVRKEHNVIDLRTFRKDANPGFPHAPHDWTVSAAQRTAATEGLRLNDDHWLAVRALQEFFARHDAGPPVNPRELHNALEEKFHSEGGMKYLYRLFPGGPVAQGCRLAGLQPPAGSVDRGFGSVQ